MWRYVQSTGELFHEHDHVAFGYAGLDAGKNNPDLQDVHDTGPLPCAFYTILAPVDTISHGPYVMWLVPDPGSELFGRSAFGIHGDSKEHPGKASHGCIVLARFVREMIWKSGDHRLQVVAYPLS